MLIIMRMFINTVINMFIKKELFLKSSLLCFVGCTSVLAQAEPKSDLTELADVLVTSSKEARFLKDVPVRTQVITASEIHQKHATNLAEVLQNFPGVQLKEIHGKAGQSVWMQGFDSDRVLVLIDGNPLPASTGSSVDLSQVSVAGVERIEIVKGAASALYGTSAMGGVINVITQKTPPKPQLNLDLQTGSWQGQDVERSPMARHILTLGASNRVGDWEGQFNAKLDDSNGWTIDPAQASTQGESGQRVNLSGVIGYQFEPGLSLRVQPRYFHEDLTTVLDNFVPGTGSLPKDKVELTDSYQLSAVLDNQTKKDRSWQLRLMAEDYQNESRQDVQSTLPIDQKRLTDINEYQASFDYGYELNPKHSLRTGVVLKQQSLNVRQHKLNSGWVTEVDNQKAHSQEFYAQDSWFVTDHLEILPGVRVHHDEDFGRHISPMLSALWSQETPNYGRLNLRASFGNGYRVPNLKERYYIFDHSHLGYMVLGNSDLKPESSLSYQLGGEWYYSKHSSVQLNVFFNDATDLIESIYSESDSQASDIAIYRYQNIEKTSTRGLEVSFSHKLSPKMKLNGHYNWLKAKDEITGKKLVNRPEHEVAFGAEYSPVKTLQLNMDWRYQSKEYIDVDNLQTSPAFSVMDFRLNQSISPHWAWYAGIKNAFDKQREFTGADYRPEEGRYLYVGIRWQRNKY